MFPFQSIQIAELLGVKHYGPEITIQGVEPLSKIKKGRLVFVNSPIFMPPLVGAFLILNKRTKIAIPDGLSYILVDNPKLAYAKITQELIRIKKTGIDKTACLGESTRLGENIYIGKNVVIDGEVEIGDNAYIGNNVTILGKCQLGNNIFVSSGCVIGDQGFSCPLDQNHVPISIYHIGGVVIGDDVFIGSSTNIQRGTISNTIISNSVKISQMVSIGHNVVIDECVRIGGRAHISGSVSVKKNVFIGSGAVIADNIQIAEFSRIGSGAVILSNVGPRRIIRAVDSPALDFIEG